MKIIVNYDVLDKISEAKKGYSLNRCIKRTAAFASISAAIGLPDNLITGNINPDLWFELVSYLLIHSTFTGAYVFALNELVQKSAQYSLKSLVNELRSKCVKTDEEAILDTYKYKTEYDVGFSSIVPIIQQKKYLMVPVRDEYFGDKEISLVQEHTIGTKQYVLSLGEPEKQKVYSLGFKTMNGR